MSDPASDLDAEQAYRETLSGLGSVIDFDISGLDRLGVPVTSCSLAVDGRLVHHGNGYGATVRSATLSGLGELAEGVLSERALEQSHPEVATRNELIGRAGASGVIDPRLLCLPAGCGYDDDQRLTWVPVRRLRDESAVLVPVEFVASETGELPAGTRSLIVPITNGLGAGLDPSRAIAHGVGEIVQRHTNGLRFRALDAQSPVIDPAGLPEPVRTLIARFADAGIEVSIKYAGSAFGMFSCYAVGLDRAEDALSDPIRLTACGEAADPSAETAMIKAVLEYANSRSRKAFCFGANPMIPDVAPAAYWQQLPPADGEPRAIEAMQAWGRLPAEELRELTAADLGTRVSLADVAPAPVPTGADPLAWRLEHLGDRDVLSSVCRVGDVWTAKTIVTGCEVETMSYGRIGEANVRASIEADLGLVWIGPSPYQDYRHRVCLTAEAEERIGGPAWFSYARAEAVVGPLYPLYREPPRHSVSVGGSVQPQPMPVGLGR